MPTTLQFSSLLLLIALPLIQSFDARASSFGPPQDPSLATTLELNKPVAREISGGERHNYRIELSSRQSIRIKITQTSVNLGVIVGKPDGQIVQMFEPFGVQTELNFAWVAEISGSYRIEIYSAAKAAPGRYQIQLLELRPATDDDVALQQARELFAQFGRLNREARFLEARSLLIRCLEIRERVLGSSDLLVARTRMFLATSYELTGDYNRAEPLLLEGIHAEEKALGSDDPEVAGAIIHLGSLYLLKGDYFKAEEVDLKALKIYERAGLMNSSSGASLLSSLGGIYQNRGDYENASKYYEQSRAVWEKLLGPDHFHLAPSYTHLGQVAYDAGNYAEAETMFQRALTLAEKGLGADHTNVTTYRNDLAMLYCTTGDYAKGTSLYQQSLAVHTEKTAMGFPVVQEIFMGLARCEAAQAHTSEAVKFLARANELQERYVGVNLGAGSEREKRAFLSGLWPRLYRDISLHVGLAPNDPQARDLAALAVLQQKGRIQDAVSASLAELHRRSSPADQKLLDQLKDTTAQLARLVLANESAVSPAERESRIKTLAAQKENLEEEISLHSAGYYRAPSMTLDAIKSAIPPDAALIEFIAYQPFNPGAPDNEKAYGPSRYVAYVIENRGDVSGIELGPTKELDSVIDAWRQSLRDPRRKDAQQLARTVDERIMRPVRRLLGSATHLLISPDGELNLMPFAALTDENGQYLIQHFAFTYLTSGRDLLRLQVARESKSNPLIVADPAFGDPGTMSSAQTRNAQTSHSRNGRQRSITSAGSLADVYFAQLEGTELEAQSIQRIFPDARVMTGAEATAEAVKQARAPLILHLATHGFFLSVNASESKQVGTGSPSKTRPSTHPIDIIDNPLLRSGLALAGANLRKGKGDDGILTALEASGLNLWGTKLVVLSACDTGLGEVHNGEGVYGLRRAFVLAGAESLVMSLWHISDYTTRELMTNYYRNLKQGLGRGDALRQVQLDMLKKNPNLHPFYWANFIQAGEWANLDGQR